jgi:biofilm PGA synthesis N-glycosyltransferase PgaC
LGSIYISIRAKFIIVLLLASCWAILSLYLAKPWFNDLTAVTGPWLAGYLIGFIAIVPGFMNAFVVASLMLDRRPKHSQPRPFPPITVLVAAFNEENGINDTLTSLGCQDYPAPMRIIVLNDGSSDETANIAKEGQRENDQLQVLNFDLNRGKAHVLNIGLQNACTDIVLTVDGDCYVKSNAVRNLVERYLSDPSNTAAVAGEILIRNSRQNWITKAQEWDYFLGIASIKRIQSLFQGTLVAQGAFSLYDRKIIESLGGWSNTVGEDIVLTWKILDAGYRVGHAEDACVFTRCPDSLKSFIRQRQRWSRGLIEAFKANPRILFKPRMTTIFIWWNLLFPLMDVAYTIGFMPGIVLACFGYFWIVGPMTLALLPVAAVLNVIMLHTSEGMFKAEGLKIRRNLFGFLFYMLAYCMILQPACVFGYLSELLKLRKSWGTK